MRSGRAANAGLSLSACIGAGETMWNVVQWVRRYWDDEDVWFVFELDGDGWVTRHLELQGPDRSPRVAASLVEWLREREAGRLQQYQAKYGVVAEMPLSSDELTEWQAVSAAQFEELWHSARSRLDS
jgi:hypothetical protein